MKKSLLILLFLKLSLLSDSLFITDSEYSAQLYKNPRGIGCFHCHGDNGEGKLIAKYIHKSKDREFVAPAINHLDRETFIKAMKENRKGMPRYFLTDNEIEKLYFHVNPKKKLLEEVRDDLNSTD